jgi:hypothetical protein
MNVVKKLRQSVCLDCYEIQAKGVNVVPYPGGGFFFFFFFLRIQRVQTGSEHRRATYSVGTVAVSLGSEVNYTYLYLMPRLRIRGATLPLPQCLYGVHKDRFTFLMGTRKALIITACGYCVLIL